jgi:hypothetical protein
MIYLPLPYPGKHQFTFFFFNLLMLVSFDFFLNFSFRFWKSLVGLLWYSKHHSEFLLHLGIFFYLIFTKYFFNFLFIFLGCNCGFMVNIFFILEYFFFNSLIIFFLKFFNKLQVLKVLDRRDCCDDVTFFIFIFFFS